MQCRTLILPSKILQLDFASYPLSRLKPSQCKVWKESKVYSVTGPTTDKQHLQKIRDRYPTKSPSCKKGERGNRKTKNARSPSTWTLLLSCLPREPDLPSSRICSISDVTLVGEFFGEFCASGRRSASTLHHMVRRQGFMYVFQLLRDNPTSHKSKG